MKIVNEYRGNIWQFFPSISYSISAGVLLSLTDIIHPNSGYSALELFIVGFIVFMPVSLLLILYSYKVIKRSSTGLTLAAVSLLVLSAGMYTYVYYAIRNEGANLSDLQNNIYILQSGFTLLLGALIPLIDIKTSKGKKPRKALTVISSIAIHIALSAWYFGSLFFAFIYIFFTGWS